jgi:transposase InsO family protein
MDVWEADLLGFHNIAKNNDGVECLLAVMDVHSKFLHIVPIKNKTGKSVAAALLPIFSDNRYNKHVRRRPILLRTDRGKEFINRTFQDALRR